MPTESLEIHSSGGTVQQVISINNEIAWTITIELSAFAMCKQKITSTSNMATNADPDQTAPSGAA